MEWTRIDGDEVAHDVNGWALRVFRYEALPGEPERWCWSGMKFENPADDENDRIIHIGGEAPTKTAAKRSAAQAAASR